MDKLLMPVMNSTSANGMILSMDYGNSIRSYGSTTTTDFDISIINDELGGSVRIIENTNATFDLTGIQLEIGENATDFEHRSLMVKNLPCVMRYYHEMGDTNTNELTLMDMHVNNTTIYTSVDSCQLK